MYKQKTCQHSIKMSVQEKHNYNLTTDDDCFITGTLLLTATLKKLITQNSVQKANPCISNTDRI